MSIANKEQDIFCEKTKLDYDSEDIIEESDDETHGIDFASLHVSKKRKINVEGISENLQSQEETQEKFHNYLEMNEEKQKVNCDDISFNIKQMVTPNRANRKKSGPKRKATQAKNKPMPKKSKNKQSVDGNINDQQKVAPRRSSRQNRVKASFQEISSEEEDAFHTDNDNKDPEYSTEKSSLKLMKSINHQERKPVKTKMKKQTVPEESQSYELEYSIKPRIVAPRYTDLKKVLIEINEEKPSHIFSSSNSTESKQEKLKKKIASGSLNENFVRINIKKKVFVRGKRGRSFSKYKKSQWRSNKAKALCGPDMDMGGCDGGVLTCFNCGQIGHFAKNCKAGKGDGLLSLNAADSEEKCPYPTLEEASQMAQASALSIRKSNRKQTDPQEEIPFDELESEQLLEEAIKLEEYVKKLDVKNYMDNVNVVEPYYKLREDNTLIDTPVEVYEALRKFGHSQFRPGQETTVMRILSGKSTLVTLSTGSGKSLCYQLPAYLYSQREPCISLIVSPLVSLMDDQITGIAKFMKAGCLHSNQTKSQKNNIMDAISKGELSILLVSPEAIVSGEKQTGFNSFLRRLPPIAFACIDEAHCVSQWSHNFRPSYLMICRVLRESLGVKTILGLTATATRATCDSIVKHLQIPDGEEGIISNTPLPDNLVLTASMDSDKDRALLALLSSERFADCKSIIVYCIRRQECERIAAFLRTAFKNETVCDTNNKKRKRINLQAEAYHAGLAASRRRNIQNAFMSCDLRIVVATVAFGMGINKSDIRAVVHYNLPNSFESYVQEVGRAGRDGLPAYCHAFLDKQGKDVNELRRHIHANSVDRHVIRKLLQKVFLPCSCTGTCPKHEVAFSIESTVRALDIPEENISTLLCYLQLDQNKYIELLNPAYTWCKIISYGGPLEINKAAEECAPLAMALALRKNRESDDPNVLEFPVVDIAAAMGWESGICKHKLKNLEWTTVNNQPKRSMISVQFSNLGFRLLAPGNLPDDKLDEALDILYNRVCDQEQKSLLQLYAIHQTLFKIAKTSFHDCLTDLNDDELKSRIRDYFSSDTPLVSDCAIVSKSFNEEQVVRDIQSLISTYRDNSFTGRAVARIFHGIQSPNYPSIMWGRCKFWRCHLDKDFHQIVKLATREIIRMK